MDFPVFQLPQGACFLHLAAPSSRLLRLHETEIEIKSDWK